MLVQGEKKVPPFDFQQQVFWASASLDSALAAASLRCPYLLHALCKELRSCCSVELLNIEVVPVLGLFGCAGGSTWEASLMADSRSCAELIKW